jgi:hypothetical protein
MASYDKTFCSSSNICANKQCEAWLSKTDKERMDELEIPIWMADFKADCKKFKQLETVKER